MIFDPVYLILILAMGALSFGASRMVKKAFTRGQRVRISSGLTGREVAQRILDNEHITDVQVVEVQGMLSDHYNPMSKTLALSPDVFHGVSASSAGVAAHEVGHAIQHAKGYTLMWFRSFIVPVANIGSMIGPWIVIIGLVLGAASGAGMGRSVAMLGVILFGMSTLFTLVTVPVEFDASARARNLLVQLGITQPGKEDDTVKKVFNAAGLTYVAAAISSIAMLLYWAAQAGLLGNSDD